VEALPAIRSDELFATTNHGESTPIEGAAPAEVLDHFKTSLSHGFPWGNTIQVFVVELGHQKLSTIVRDFPKGIDYGVDTSFLKGAA
jgi:hypothetical protein